MTAKMTVRDATVHDAAELAALAASAYRETYRRMVDAGVVDAVVAQTCTAEAFARLVEAAASGGRICARRNGILPHRRLPRLPLRG